jgi:ADP-ribose pyrophosphatase YjhB (NUDIX family)
MGRLDDWRFCPRCASAIELEGRHALCAACGFDFWGNAAPAAEALVVRDGRALLARRAIEPRRGLWDLPGGFLDEWEHPHDGVRRELLEETGLAIEVGPFLGAAIEDYGGRSVLILTFLATAPVGEPRAADDVAELAWVGPEEMPPPEEIAWRWHAEVLARWASGSAGPES